ncbi:type II toxin-antitoxin system antitoxin SocA domain-containing protein [Maritimibacter alexandrii]|uniref:type II toxin-antitoxin system antitoxin SocA domain-containing protein n=1 Tax=Maritimibacter alexandrii TaxID=2570355 RepID=UPI0011089BA2|nr:type II toxin-antitoxin system antitoxin SocA domain-containing protein [Maritimibacter alexandrii]
MAEFNREKFKDLIHQVAWQVRDRDGWGLVKLFKVMWFFEARRYTIEGEVFSGGAYQRDEFGPRPRGVYPILAELEREGRVSVRDEKFHSRTVKRPIALTAPPPGLLNESQARDLSYWISYVDGLSAAEISEESHDYGWEIVSQGDDIPLYAILAERVREPKGEELEWALMRASELGLS